MCAQRFSFIINFPCDQLKASEHSSSIKRKNSIAFYTESIESIQTSKKLILVKMAYRLL